MIKQRLERRIRIFILIGTSTTSQVVRRSYLNSAIFSDIFKTITIVTYVDVVRIEQFYINFFPVNCQELIDN